jgi:hypothetical protein
VQEAVCEFLLRLFAEGRRVGREGVG